MEAEAMGKKQLKWIQFLTVAVLALLCVTLVIAVCLLQTAKAAQELGTEIQSITAQVDELISGIDAEALQESIEALEHTAKDLEAVDWKALGDNVNDSLEQVGSSLRDMSEAVEKVDFDSLQDAIASLQTVMEPLAKFVSRFG